MPIEWLSYGAYALGFVLLILLAAAVRQLLGSDAKRAAAALGELRGALDQAEGRLRADLQAQRSSAADEARGTREELAGTLRGSTESVVQSVGEISRLQQSQLEGFALQLGQLRVDVTGTVRGLGDSLTTTLGQSSQAQSHQLESVLQQLQQLVERNETRLGALQQAVENRLREMREDNAQQLEKMRTTVDEKLHQTLETRLGETFRIVSDRLEAVHRGLGEMQNLAAGVGDLKKVLTNVKTRGTWGEIQLGNLLEQVLAAEQYQTNVATKPNSAERVEFAIRLPGRGEHRDDVVWLPIDAKFPQEDYQRLVEAQEQGNAEGAAEAGRRLEAQVKHCARQIAEKYLNPPLTTDFAILYLPTEGLYAEVVRRAGILETLQRERRVVVAGPTTLAALLNSLQMGFRTLAVEKRSSEVWTLLGAVKNEFNKFGTLLEGVQRKLSDVTNTIDRATKQSRTIEKKLKSVQELPAPAPEVVLPEEPPPE